MKKLVVIILLIILILPSLSLNALSKEENNTVLSNSDEPTNDGIIKNLLRLRFNIGSFPGCRYFVQQLFPPVPIQAYPEAISLNYYNKTYFEIGGKNENGTEWEKLVKLAMGYSWGWMTRLTRFSFEVVPPENSSMDVWNIEFYPPSIEMQANRENMEWFGAETPLKTNVSIRLKSNIDPSIVTQDVVLKINIMREEVIDLLRIAKGIPEYAKKTSEQYEEYIKKEHELGFTNPYWSKPFNVVYGSTFLRAVLLIWNLNAPKEPWVDSTVEILIKVKKYHLAKIDSPISPVEIEPNQVKSIPVTITNMGSHIDTYNFRLKCDDENIIVTPPPALTLKPGEEGQALVGVAASRRFYSADDLTPIYIEAYSVEDPENIINQTIALKTSGIYTAGSTIFNSVIVVITIVVILFLFIYLSKKYKQKPRKIKEKKTATSYIKSIPSGIKKSSNKITESFKKYKKEKPIEPQKEEIIQEPQIPIPEEKMIPPPVETKIDADKYMKEQAIQRALNQQEKQRKKLKR